ncbi:MAG: alpha-L-fucosidase [Phycisphaerales bacterium]|nr:MAG: alpha-L-fucosidase [Phycisphaerales bacterium]
MSPINAPALGLATLSLVLSQATIASPDARSPANRALTAAEDHDARMGWWREARFGLFIHWGLYAIPAGEWGEGTDYAEWIMNSAHIPVEQYEPFVKQFNPVKFDADDWVRMAKDAGMKYIVITSKHHDGFCLFDSALTEYDVMSTPFARDILKELSEACERGGIRMCWYHSIMDWHHPDYLPRRGWESRSAEGADYDRYVEYLRGQVTELLTNYGDIGVMWFDGQWEGTWTHEYGQPLYDLCRQLQPEVIVNDRVDKGRKGHSGVVDDKYAGDFGTPEQHIPATGLPGVDWETCMTMNRHWGYNKNDDAWKSTEDLIRKLVDIASKNGNFLLNVGPKADGTFPEPCVTRLREIGKWMKVNGEAIYGTSASPFSELPFNGRCTVKGGDQTTTLYLHAFDWPSDGALDVHGIGNDCRRAYLLADREEDLPVMRRGTGVRIVVPPDAPDAICSVVALEITGRPVVYDAPQIVSASEVFVRPLSVELQTPSDELEIRYTLDGTDPNEGSALYDKPITLTDTTLIKARSFHNGRAVSEAAEATFSRVTPHPDVARPEGGLRPGLRCEVFEGDWNELPQFADLQPSTVETVRTIELPGGPAVEYVGRRFRGYLRVPRDDAYLFALTSDDGSRLFIDGVEVIDNDGLHGAEERRGVVPLAVGFHRIKVEYFNKTGGAELRLRFAPVGRELIDIPEQMLMQER